MRILKGAVAFALVFCTLAATVVCAAVGVDTSYAEATKEVGFVQSETLPEEEIEIQPKSDAEIAQEGEGSYTARLTAPAKTNPYYYSNINVFYKFGYGMPNCTCYAYGRAYEILKAEPKLCIYDANQWFDYNKDNGYYSYGQTPKLGAIACWKYKNYNSGHVAVVEKITDDTVYYSNSAWSGENFYVDSLPVDDPVKGRPDWEFQGYIYIGDFASGAATGDIYIITSDDGVNMRSGAGTSFEKVSVIPFGGIAIVTEIKNADGYTWGYTTYGGVRGWFATDFAQLVEDDEPSEPTQPPTQPPTELPTEPSIEEPTQPEKVFGDVDLDGDMSVLDAALIQMALVGKKTLTQAQTATADVDSDGEMSVMDASKICRILVGLEY